MKQRAMMKRMIFLLFLVAVIGLFSFVAADQQPSLLNHQFYGEVFWAKNSITPAVITATVEGANFSSQIRSSPCLEDPCKGRYGFDSDNTLRVQGTEGEIISFLIDGVVVGEHAYKNDDVTQLDFDLRAEVKKIEPVTETEEVVPEENVSANVSAVVPEEEIAIPKPVPVPKVAEIKEVPQPKIQDFTIPTTPREAGKEVEKKGTLFNLYLVSGIVLIVAAIGIIIYVYIERKKKSEEELEEI